MKITTLFVFAAISLYGNMVNSQTPGHTYTTTNAQGQEVSVTYPAEFKVSIPVKDLPAAEEDPGTNFTKEVYNLRPWNAVVNPAGDYTDTESIQKEQGQREGRAPIVSWNGMNGAFPPDPSGAAGPNHYVQAVNTQWRVYNKTGGGVTTAANLSTLWPGSQNLGDPIVMYDRHADRWFISQFRQSPSNGLLIAVSTTNDPAGTYYQYSYNLSQFPDYPKYSVWWDGYYCTSNSNKRAIVFNRAKMLAGDATAEMVALDATSAANQGFRSVLPADADGPLPPNGTPCYFFNAEDDAWSGVPTDRIRIYEMTANWATPGNTAIVQSQLLNVDPWSLNFTGGFENITQPGTTQKIDAIMQVFMYRAQHMRWVGYNSVLLTCAVNLGSNRSGIRWIELRDANNGVWAIHQQGTYAPDATASRWMSSAAMDVHGNIGMGYSLTDPTNTIYPSIYYTGRLAGDPAGQMTFGEMLAVAGGGSQTSGDRYGDYAQMSLDPDGSTFWYTGEYLQSSAQRRTRIFSFNIQQMSSIEDTNPYYNNLEMTAALQNNEILVNAKGIHGNDELTVDVIGIDGKVIKNNMMYAVGGNLTHRFNTDNMASGIYFVRIGNVNFQKTVKIFVD